MASSADDALNAALEDMKWKTNHYLNTPTPHTGRNFKSAAVQFADALDAKGFKRQANEARTASVHFGSSGPGRRFSIAKAFGTTLVRDL